MRRFSAIGMSEKSTPKDGREESGGEAEFKVSKLKAKGGNNCKFNNPIFAQRGQIWGTRY
jgi:hypothetical protein